MKNSVFFYSSVNNKDLFRIQRFYHIDIELIKELGNKVYESNRILDFLLFWKYDVAFIYFYKFGLLPAIISRMFFKKVYFTGGIDNLEESSTSKKEYKIQKFFFKLCYLFADNCFLVSTTDEANVCKIYNGRLPKKTTLSFHTIEVENFIPKKDEAKQSDFSTIIWMESLGNVYRKGADKALEVFKYLSQKNEFASSNFYIIGKEGEGSKYLRKICMELNIQEKVFFTGSIEEEDKIRILKNSKYYFQLSSFEGFGIAALEALAAKNIVIHTGKGGLKDTIKDFGIIINLNSDIEKQIETVYKQLINFEVGKLDIAQRYIIDNFSNIKRKNDFGKYLHPM